METRNSDEKLDLIQNLKKSSKYYIQSQFKKNRIIYNVML